MLFKYEYSHSRAQLHIKTSKRHAAFLSPMELSTMTGEDCVGLVVLASSKCVAIDHIKRIVSRISHDARLRLFYQVIENFRYRASNTERFFFTSWTNTAFHVAINTLLAFIEIQVDWCSRFFVVRGSTKLPSTSLISWAVLYTVVFQPSKILDITSLYRFPKIRISSPKSSLHSHHPF